MQSFHILDALGAIGGVCSKLWHYKILSIANRDIFFSNLVSGSALIFLGFRYFSRVAENIRNRVKIRLGEDKDAANAVEKILIYACYLAYIMLILEVSNLPVSTFAFLGSALIFSIGLGAQTIMNNVLSGLILMIERPVRINDIVEVENMIGRVKAISARCMTLRTFNGVEILIPNGKLLQSNLINYTSKSNILVCYATITITQDVVQQQAMENLESLSNELYKLVVNNHNQLISKLDIYLSAVERTDGGMRHTYTLVYNCQLGRQHKIHTIKHHLNTSLLKLIPGHFTVVHNQLNARDPG